MNVLIQYMLATIGDAKKGSPSSQPKKPLLDSESDELKSLPELYKNAIDYYQYAKALPTPKITNPFLSIEDKNTMLILKKIRTYLKKRKGVKELKGDKGSITLTDPKEIEALFPCIGFRRCEAIFSSKNASTFLKHQAYKTLSAINIHFLLTFFKDDEGDIIEDHIQNTFYIYGNFVNIISTDNEAFSIQEPLSLNEDQIVEPLMGQVAQDASETDQAKYDRLCSEISTGNFESDQDTIGHVQALFFLAQHDERCATEAETPQDQLSFSQQALRRYEALLQIEDLPPQDDATIMKIVKDLVIKIQVLKEFIAKRQATTNPFFSAIGQ